MKFCRHGNCELGGGAFLGLRYDFDIDITRTSANGHLHLLELYPDCNSPRFGTSVVTVCILPSGIAIADSLARNAPGTGKLDTDFVKELAI
jgi:hypothetical protein